MVGLPKVSTLGYVGILGSDVNRAIPIRDVSIPYPQLREKGPNTINNIVFGP